MSIALYGEALLDERAAVHLRRADGELRVLPAARWSSLDEVDLSLVGRPTGWTLDIGCGPGRFVAGLMQRGVPALGIDIAPAAVALTRGRGGLALRRDVFARVPGAGRWRWALLLDGNIGIGGAPTRLLRRTRELLAPEGRLLVEVEPPGCVGGEQHVRLERNGSVGRWFPWAWVSSDELLSLATGCGFRVAETWSAGERWFGELACA